LLKQRRLVRVPEPGWRQQRLVLRRLRGSWQELRLGMGGMRATAASR
jgi:hypothetical protein